MEQPINIHKWIAKNKDKLQPPIGNKLLFKENGYLIMVVGGPNARFDYHISNSPEFFYQIEGTLKLKIIDNNNFKEVTLNSGDMFLLPANIPHSPIRSKNSVGIVIESVRSEEELDGFLWFCNNCNHKLHEVFLPLKNIEEDIKKVALEFNNSLKLRTCKNCDNILEV